VSRDRHDEELLTLDDGPIEVHEELLASDTALANAGTLV